MANFRWIKWLAWRGFATHPEPNHTEARRGGRRRNPVPGQS